jgi:uncharacterized membrane protein YoaK (UPF0700 family)
MAVFHGVIIFSFMVGVITARMKARAGLKSWVALSITSRLLALHNFLEKYLAAVLLIFAIGVQNSAANRFNGVALSDLMVQALDVSVLIRLSAAVLRVEGRPPVMLKEQR